MPTYDYICDACGDTFEQWQSFHDDALTKCLKCKKKKLRRLIGIGAAVVFKGSGFYETDYRRDDKYKAAEKSDADAATAKPETKAETPAAAADGTAKPAATSPPPPPVADPPASSGTKKGKKGK